MTNTIANICEMLRERADFEEASVFLGTNGVFVKAQFKLPDHSLITELIIDPIMDPKEGGTLRVCAFDAGVVPFAVDGRKLCECLTSKLSVGQLSFAEGEARAIAYIGHQFFEGYAPTTLVLYRLV